MSGLGNIDLQRYHDYELAEKVARMTGGISGNYDYGKSDLVQAANGHYSDSGKLPYHPTFSTDSKYSNSEFKGGEWSQDSNGRHMYSPSEDMINSGYAKGLGKYFSAVEPDSSLVLPKGYSLNVDGDIVKNGDLNKSNEESYKRNILNKKLIQETSLGNIFNQQGE